MTKGFLCIMAALGTTLSGAIAFGESPGADTPVVENARAAAVYAADQAGVAAAQAARPAPRNVAGWSVLNRVDRSHAPIVASLGRWSIVADRIEGDRLIRPRVIGPDTVMWGESARLLADGVEIQQIFVTSRNQNVRASAARITLEPPNVVLDGVGEKAQRAE